jgi:hypothetical protein
MTHWGWYWKVKKKHMARLLCSKLTTIDSFKMFKNKEFSGFRVDPVDINAHLTDKGLKVSYGQNKGYFYMISVDKQPCQYGGFRYFFKCPLCQMRMRMLYLAEQSLFLCRKCLNLAYKSQKLCPSKRYRYEMDKIEAGLKNRGGNAYKRPKGMRCGTFKTLRDKYRAYSIKEKEALREELLAYYPSHREKMLNFS